MQHRDALNQVKLDRPCKNVARDQKRRKHRGYNADRKGDREPFDGPGAEPE